MDSTSLTAAVNGFEAGMHRRRLAQIELLVAEMKNSIRNFDIDIKAEEQRTRISDPRHVAYSTLAMAATQRRDNLKRTVAELEERLATMRQDAEAQTSRSSEPSEPNAGGTGVEHAA
jgi:hypothetical protein